MLPEQIHLKLYAARRSPIDHATLGGLREKFLKHRDSKKHGDVGAFIGVAIGDVSIEVADHLDEGI